jgi:hypothetical protein
MPALAQKTNLPLTQLARRGQRGHVLSGFETALATFLTVAVEEAAHQV